MTAISQDDTHLAGGGWYQLQDVPAVTYVCGFCGDKVSSARGYAASPQKDGSGAQSQHTFLRICPSCEAPTYFTRSGKVSPGPAPGAPVQSVPDDLEKLFTEARLSAASGAHTAAVLVCRKMLMNIAVAEGAKEGQKFINYVGYLANHGYVPPNGSVWVDYIRKRGNEANHEIALMEPQDALALITFTEMLLRFIYEFPNMVPKENVAEELLAANGPE